MEKTVTITLEEYERLREVNNKILHAFVQKKPIIYYNSVIRVGFSSYNHGEYTVINNDEFSKNLMDILSKLQSEISDLYKENMQLKSQIKKKKWYEL